MIIFNRKNVLKKNTGRHKVLSSTENHHTNLTITLFSITYDFGTDIIAGLLSRDP